MRLGTCVAIELVVGLSLAGGTAWGVLLGAGELRDRWQREAHAASLEVAPHRAYSRLPLLLPVDASARVPEASATPLFEGVRDDILLAPLRTGTIERVKFNRGGSSISLRLDFDNGARAAFKPRQINPQSVPRREVAAYRVNLLLGLYAVQPAIGRRFAAGEIFERLHPESVPLAPRLMAEIVPEEDGTIVGELSWWIPVIREAQVDGFAIDSNDGVVTWKRYLTVGAPIPDSELDMVRQISNMVLFDFLINNPDRWTGGNARASVDGRMLYFMDNTLSFGLQRDGHRKARTYLERSQKFSRRLVARLRSLTEAELRDAVSAGIEPFEFLLDDDEIAAVLARRDWALAYIESLVETHGRSAVLVFP